MNHPIFIVEDDEATLKLYENWLAKMGLEVRSFLDAQSCLNALEAFEPSAVCLDLGLPDVPGLEVLERVKRRRPQVPVIVLTGENDAKVGVQAMKMGATDYLVKPISREDFEFSIINAVRQHELVLEVRALRSQVTEVRRAHDLVGRSTSMNRIASQIGLVLQNDVPVFIEGETGTGKELIARTIHANGIRSNGPFVPVNCGAVPSELQESQFFGHEKGSFTGAMKQHVGFFEEASGGTIFLDEIGELSPAAQVKLLRVLQDKVVRRVGSQKEIPIDVRVVSATHRNIRAMVDAGEFREDLYYRLVVFPLTVPPLREREGDIPLLLGHFLRSYCEQMGLAVPEVTDEALACLAAYAWPGNVRELQNVVQYALLACQGEPIEAVHLPTEIPRDQADFVSTDEERIQLIDPLTGNVKSFDRLELEIFLRARDLAGGSVTKAAQYLGVGRATIYRRLQALQKSGLTESSGEG